MNSSIIRRRSRSPCVFARALLISALILSTAQAHAGDHRDLRDAVQRGEIVPLIVIRQHALQHFGGRIIEVDLERRRDGAHYELEVLINDGRVIELTYDAKTGALLAVEGQFLETVFGRGGRPLP